MPQGQVSKDFDKVLRGFPKTSCRTHMMRTFIPFSRDRATSYLRQYLAVLIRL